MDAIAFAVLAAAALLTMAAKDLVAPPLLALALTQLLQLSGTMQARRRQAWPLLGGLCSTDACSALRHAPC